MNVASIHPKLQYLKDVTKKLDAERKAFKKTYQQWYTWNNWARKQYWYDSWMDRHHLKNRHVKTYKHLTDKVVLKQYKGIVYYKAWVDSKQRITDLEYEQDNAFAACRKLKRKIVGNQKYIFSTAELAKAYGRSVPATHNRIRRTLD